MIQTRQEQYAKEADDIGALIVEIVKTAKAKKPIAELADEFVLAIQGVENVDDEAGANRAVFMKTIGARLFEAAEAILPAPKPVVPPA